MKRAGALVVLALLAAAPSLWRALRPPVMPAGVRSTKYTREADRVMFGERMDLNRVDAAGLEMIPGIGPALARRIVEDRERRGRFESVEAVERVRGIGPALRGRLERWVLVRSEVSQEGGKDGKI